MHGSWRRKVRSIAYLSGRQSRWIMANRITMQRRHTMPKAPALKALTEAVSGLLYQSESDEPFEVFLWNGREVGESLSREKVLEIVRMPPDTPVEEMSL